MAIRERVGERARGEFNTKRRRFSLAKVLGCLSQKGVIESSKREEKVELAGWLLEAFIGGSLGTPFDPFCLLGCPLIL